MECASLHSARPQHSFIVVWSDQRPIRLVRVGNLDDSANRKRLNADANRRTIFASLKLPVSRHVTDKFPEEWIDEICEADPPTDDLDLEDDDRVPKGPLPSREEIDAACAELARWQSTSTFHSIEKALRLRNADPDFFLQPQLKFLHDAYVLAKFAAKIGADEVRLADRRDQWPDGFVRISKHTIKVEVTSTHGDRKLGEEYRKPRAMRFDPVEDWHARADSITGYLETAVREKVRRYGARYSDCWLVVYLNISEWGVRQREIEQIITETMIRYSDYFREISVLWKGNLYSVSDSAMQGHA